MIKKFWRILQNPFQKWFLWTLLIINLMGSVYGFYWYRYQLAETPWYYLLFVPDSPLSSTLFVLILVTILWQKRIGILELLACFWVIKYGIWAVIINGDVFYSYRAMFGWDNLMLALSHAGMALEGFLFLRHLRFSRLQLGLVALWMFGNDFVDYVLNQHPYLFAPEQLALARALAITLSIGLIVLGNHYWHKQNMLASRVLL